MGLYLLIAADVGGMEDGRKDLPVRGTAAKSRPGSSASDWTMKQEILPLIAANPFLTLQLGKVRRVELE